MKKIIFSILALSLVTASTFAAEPPSGDEIAQQINARDEGHAVSRSVIMVMTDKRGKQRVRETRSYRKYFGKDKRTVIHYLKPKNIKKTAFLTYDYADTKRDDDQWLYLPANRKVRRISASDRGDYFLGTDFTYEDIKKESKVSIEDYHRKTLGKEMIDGHLSYIIESTPINQEIARELGYGKVTQWVDAKIWMVRKAKFDDPRGKPLKTIHTREIRQVQGIWTAHLMEVLNHKTRHQTQFTFRDVDYKKEISDDMFTKRALRRGI